MLPLVPKILHIASKDGLGPQPFADVFVLTEVCSPQPPQAPRWRQEPSGNVLEDLTSL